MFNSKIRFLLIYVGKFSVFSVKLVISFVLFNFFLTFVLVFKDFLD